MAGRGAAGALLFVGCHGVLAWAEQRVSSGQAALFMTSIPLGLVLIDTLRRRRLPPARVLAGARGTLGIAVLTFGAGGTSGTLLDRVALVLSGFSWAAGSLIARGTAPGRLPAAQSTAMQLAAGGAAVLVASFRVGEWPGKYPRRATGRASLGYLVMGGTVLGFGRTPGCSGSRPRPRWQDAFVNPVIALALAWLWETGW